MITEAEVKAAQKEFWRVLAIKELTLEDAWKAALEAADKARGQPIETVRRANAAREGAMVTEAEAEAAAKALSEKFSIELLDPEDVANVALEAAAKARPEPRGCPTPGACSCISPPESEK